MGLVPPPSGPSVGGVCVEVGGEQQSWGGGGGEGGMAVNPRGAGEGPPAWMQRGAGRGPGRRGAREGGEGSRGGGPIPLPAAVSGGSARKSPGGAARFSPPGSCLPWTAAAAERLPSGQGAGFWGGWGGGLRAHRGGPGAGTPPAARLA